MEVTANFVSALSTTKNNQTGFLDECAGVARYQSNGLMGINKEILFGYLNLNQDKKDKHRSF